MINVLAACSKAACIRPPSALHTATDQRGMRVVFHNFTAEINFLFNFSIYFSAIYFIYQESSFIRNVAMKPISINCEVPCTRYSSFTPALWLWSIRNFVHLRKKMIWNLIQKWRRGWSCEWCQSHRHLKRARWAGDAGGQNGCIQPSTPEVNSGSDIFSCIFKDHGHSCEQAGLWQPPWAGSYMSKEAGKVTGAQLPIPPLPCQLARW